VCTQSQQFLANDLEVLAGRFVIHEVSDQEQPFFLTAALPLREGLTGLKPRLPSGRGLTALQARFSAVGETVELLASLARPQLHASGSIISENRIDMVMAKDMVSQSVTKVPAQSVFLDYAEVFDQPVAHVSNSNGCAAGISFDDACERALLECVERDALSIWWYGRQSRGHLNPAILDAAAPRVAWWLSNRARVTMLINITSDIGIPVVVAVSAETDGTQIAIGSAASRQLSLAAVSAVLEMVQTETSIRMAKHSGFEELEHWLAHARINLLPQCAGMPEKAGSLETGCGTILQQVAEAGFRPLVVDLSDSDYALAVAKVIVPGFCAMQRCIVPERILKHARSAQTGVTSAEAFEALEPF
jgi:ribosomal protein S12 methylthiotransferase accessory factor YcaO